jgi:hypothetical protein
MFRICQRISRSKGFLGTGKIYLSAKLLSNHSRRQTFSSHLPFPIFRGGGGNPAIRAKIIDSNGVGASPSRSSLKPDTELARSNWAVCEQLGNTQALVRGALGLRASAFRRLFA